MVEVEILNHRLSVASALAEAAGHAILPYFRSKNLGIENKEDGGYDPVP